MDYQKAIEYMRKESHKQCVNSEEQDAYIITISAMQELQALHEQGFSLERLKDIDFRKDVIEHINYYAYMGLQEELEEYKQLGTLEEVREAVEKHKWIPCSERLPEDCDNRFYMCIVENHEEDLPMFLQYDENCGFGYWYDIYDEHTLGFVDSEFKTSEELGYERVIAWMPLPEPYRPDKCHGCFGAANNDCERCMDGNEK